MTDTEARVAGLCDDGRVNPTTAIELMRLAELFNEFGDPAVSHSRTAGHVTWAVAGVTLTLSVGDCGTLGVFLTHVGGLNLTFVGVRDDADSLGAFRHHCLSAKAYLCAAVVDAAEKINGDRGCSR